MTAIYTASFRAYRADMGLGVPISLGLPRWLPEAATWPRAWVLVPTPALFDEADDEAFRTGYTARLERFGAAKIGRTLERIAREHQADKLILLCHEADPSRCHREMAAQWLIRVTGEAIDELI